MKIAVLGANGFLGKFICNSLKEELSFVLVGRIFRYNPLANNKNFDIDLKNSILSFLVLAIVFLRYLQYQYV